METILSASIAALVTLFFVSRHVRATPPAKRPRVPDVARRQTLHAGKP